MHAIILPRGHRAPGSAHQLEASRKKLEHEIVAKQAEKAEAEAENENVEKTAVAEGRYQIQGWHEKTKEIRERHQHDMQRVRDKYQSVDNAFLAWSARLREAMRGL